MPSTQVVRVAPAPRNYQPKSIDQRLNDAVNAQNQLTLGLLKQIDELRRRIRRIEKEL